MVPLNITKEDEVCEIASALLGLRQCARKEGNPSSGNISLSSLAAKIKG